MPTESIRSNNDDNNKRRSSSKFALAPDKHAHSLRRDLLLSNFDKNMTVEKARFEPIDENLVTQVAPATNYTNHATTPKIDITPAEHLVHDNTELASSLPSEMTYALTMSPSAPTLSSTFNNNVSLNNVPLTTSQSERRRINPRNEANSCSTSRKKHNNKKQTKPIMHGTASPAEVFHRNLVDAVSNVEDSDENEHYVYPYSGNESCNYLSDISSAGLHRPLSVRSTPGSSLYDSKRRDGGLGEWLKQAFYLKNSQQHAQRIPTTLEEEDDDDEWSGSEYSRRPRLRNNVKDYQSPQKPNKSSILTRWHDSFHKSISSDKSKAGRRVYPTQNNTLHHPYYYGNLNERARSTCGYTSDEEDAPLLPTRRLKRMPRNKTSWYNSSQPLTALTVDIGRVLATDKELIFDLKVQAENWNWWTVRVTDADISIFAFSQIVPTSISNNTTNATDIEGVGPAEYLGTLVHLDEPLSIRSNVFDKSSKEAISQIRIKSPGADISGNERW
ncbi:hypothetical protein HPULCUR_000472 [Helicostylum pulchrum]|uniref:SH3 domain-containing protein n=1 Tax=Helicostylum pulchrum TaxID=562976 RepID=A0ABP9XK12_9FUNG